MSQFFEGMGSLARARAKSLSRLLLFHLFHFFLYVLDLCAVLADIETQVGVDAHVLVGDPDQSKEGDQVAAPVVEQQFVVRQDEEESRHIMAEAEFTGKKKIKFAAPGVLMRLTL